MNGEYSRSVLDGGLDVAGTSGEQVFVGPATRWLYKNYGIEGGIQFPVYRTPAVLPAMRASPKRVQVTSIRSSFWADTGSFDKARDYAGVLKTDPDHIDGLLVRGRLEIKCGNPQGGFDYLSRALTLAIQAGNNEEALILLATGIAYKLLDKAAGALPNYQRSLAINRRIRQKRGVAANLSEITQIQVILGTPDDALASLSEALKCATQSDRRKKRATC